MCEAIENTKYKKKKKAEKQEVNIKKKLPTLFV